MSDTTDHGASAVAEEPGSYASVLAQLELERDRCREIDHRARNSLQLAGSLLLLMARRSNSTEAQSALKSLNQRIGAIGAVHRGFLLNPDPRQFDLTEHLRDYMTSLARLRPPGAELNLELDQVHVASSAAVPLSLVANELVCNALAHAGPAPKVHVTLTRQGDGLRLAVQDDGPGLPPRMDRLEKDGPGTEGSGFGLTIVRLMAQQLRCELAFEDAQPGVRAVVTLA